MSDGGKGSRPRPFSVSDDEYSKRWDAIFGRDLEKTKENNESSDSDADDRNNLSEQVSGIGR
jgi:hypothetical protein